MRTTVPRDEASDRLIVRRVTWVLASLTAVSGIVLSIATANACWLVLAASFGVPLLPLGTPATARSRRAHTPS